MSEIEIGNSPKRVRAAEKRNGPADVGLSPLGQAAGPTEIYKLLTPGGSAGERSERRGHQARPAGSQTSGPVEARVANVRILLASFYDYLPAPVTSSGLIARAASPGPAPGKRVPCTYCRRTGRIAIRQGRRRICPACGGYGWRTRRRLKPSHPSYEPPWDEYTGEPVEEEEIQHPHAMSRTQRDRALDQLENYERGERFGWERERQVYERRGSYVELGRALALLAERWHVGFVIIRRQYLRGLRFEPSRTTSLLTDAAEEWLAREMRGEIRVPVWLQDQSAIKRQDSVEDLSRQGLSAGQIARRLRLPKLKVQRLLRAGNRGTVAT